MTGETMETTAPPTGPPVEVRTLLRRLWRRRWLIMAALAGAGLAGAVTGFAYGNRVYEAGTVLLYRPQPSMWLRSENDQYDSLSLATQMNLVKLRANLAEARRRLELAATLPEIGAAIDVHLTKNTSLLTITARWSSAQSAADLANTIRSVYIDRQQQLRYHQELTQIDRQRQAEGRALERIDGQLDNLDRLRDRLSRQISVERAGTPEIEGLAEINIRIERLRRAILDDQTYRSNMAMLAQQELELQRAAELKRRSAISEIEYERIRAEYERRKALTDETAQIQEWRTELERLQQTVLPKETAASPTTFTLKEVMLRTVQTEIERVAVAERFAQLDRLHGERSDQLAALNADNAPPAHSDFRVVTVARPATFPTTSSRKLLAVGASLLIAVVGLGAIVAMEVFDPTVQSGPELEHLLEIRTLGVLPVADLEGSAVAASNDVIERYRLIAHRLRRACPKRGARILVTSAVHGDGKTTLAINLAALLGRQGDRVLLIDGGVGTNGRRADAATTRYQPISLHDTIPRPRTPTRGLDSYMASPDLTLTDCTTALFENVDVMPVTDALPPDHLASARVRSLLKEASVQYAIVLIDGPPVIPYADGETWAHLTDGVVLVVSAAVTRRAVMKQATERLAATDTTIIGTVLNRTHFDFLDLE